jgi:hypothetical protein
MDLPSAQMPDEYPGTGGEKEVGGEVQEGRGKRAQKGPIWCLPPLLRLRHEGISQKLWKDGTFG